MDLSSDHLYFVVAAYIITFVIICSLIFYTIISFNKKRKLIRDMEGKGIKRRRKTKVLNN